MYETGVFSTCLHNEPVDNGLCSNISMINKESCEHIQLSTILFIGDCYMKQILFVLTALLIVIGTILNLFSLYCFLKMNKRNSQNIYLSVLSLSDTINLHINFTLPLLRQFGTLDDPFRNSSILCRLTGVFTEFFLIFPAWIVVLLTFERLICILSTLKRRASFTQQRAKTSIAILAIIVLGLCIYRIVDIKGIDQISVFSVAACNGSHTSIDFMRNLNLIIWSILPVCFTFTMSVVIVYQIKIATRKLEPNDSKSGQNRYNQTTKTVLLISILFLIFHTPTGIVITVDLIYGENRKVLILIILLISRKLTVILYEISLSCKFFIYNRTFRNFKGILSASLSRFMRRENSAKIGRPIRVHSCCPNQRRYHFGTSKQSVTSPTSQSDSFVKNIEEKNIVMINRHRRTSSTSLSRTNREQQPLTIMNRANDAAYVSSAETPNLLRGHNTNKKRSLRRSISKPQITL